MNLYASLIAIALASGVTTSCSIDDTYDLDKEFNMTVGLGSEGLSLRLGNTEHVMLNDVLDIEDNDLVETDGQNLYYLVKTDHTSFDVSVKNAIGSIEHVEINSSQDVVSFDDFDNPDGASSVVVAAGRDRNQHRRHLGRHQQPPGHLPKELCLRSETRSLPKQS